MRVFLASVFIPLIIALAPTGVTGQNLASTDPAVRAVLFRADWCSNCHILEPILQDAMTQAAGTPVELVVLDFTNPERWDQSIETALENNVVQIYNAYAGTTGIVVLTAADTGERIDCINRTFSARAMANAMQQAVSTTVSFPPGQRDRQSIFCPPGRAPL